MLELNGHSAVYDPQRGGLLYSIGAEGGDVMREEWFLNAGEAVLVSIE